MAGHSLLLGLLLAVNAPASVTVSPEELAQKDEWVNRNLLSAGNTPPFSFTYGGQSSSTLLAAWGRSVATNVLDTNRTEYVLLWTNAAAGLEVRCKAVDYRDFPAVEWTVCLKNTAITNTPIIDNLLGLNVGIQRSAGGEFVLRYWNGDAYEIGGESYHPFETTLGPSASVNFAPTGGRATNYRFPYYNLTMPGGGVLIAVGWPGQWKTAFARDGGTNLAITAGQELTHLYLAPGETIRAPLMTLLFWNGTDVVRAQNLWRRWYMAHVIPRVNGQPVAPFAQMQCISSFEGGGESELFSLVAAYTNVGIQIDLAWRDAGWYPCGGQNWTYTGTWEIDTGRYPNGFKPFTDYLHTNGMKFVLWFEPERVGWSSSWLAQNHPEWLLGSGYSTLLNLGNSNALAWAKDHFDSLIKSNGVDVYRQDFNMDPLSNWRNNDASDRQGMTENLHVQGYLAYWDSLLTRNPGLVIDSCASGGRRNDLETMRRAVPLLRSDYQAAGTANAQQCHTYGISSWLPYYGSGSYSTSPYEVRSFYMPSFGCGNDADGVRAYAECRKIAPCMLGDYYPLTTYAGANDLTAWMAWQFDRPEAGDGVVQAFRRPSSTSSSFTFKLQGLESNRLYEVEDFDKTDKSYVTGHSLMEDGLLVSLNPQQAAVIYYHPAPKVTVTAAAGTGAGPAPLFAQFSATGLSAEGKPLTYAWTFGDGGTSVEQNPTHTYAAAGRYVAEVTADDGNGNIAKARVAITAIGGSKRMCISFEGYNKSGTLTNFPALVVFGTNLAANGFAYDQLASSNGWDLVFADSNTTRALNYEIERWDTNGDSYVWVQVPELTGTNTSIWTYWGNTNMASVPAPCMTNGSVWNDGYVGVWHLTNGVVLTGTDSTANGNHGTIGSAASATGGRIDGGGGFHGTVNDYIGVGTLNPLPNGMGTASVWMNWNVAGTNNNNYVLAKGDDAAGTGNWGIDLIPTTTNCSVYLLYGVAAWVGPAMIQSAPGSWHLLTAVMRPNAQEIYVDGVLAASGTKSTVTPAAGTGFFIGKTARAAPYAYAVNGAIDEVRVATSQRSSNWVWAEWMNVASNAVFNGYGAVTGVGGGVDAYGIPDSWKMLYFGGTNGEGTGALEDRDHDGMSNYAEWKAGTCPTNANSRFQVSGFGCQGGSNFVIQWSSVADRFYTIQESTNLFNGFPATVASNLPATPAMNTATVIVGQAESGFYRVKVE